MSTVTEQINEAVARPARTGMQAAPAWVIVEFIDAFAYDLDERQFGAAVLLLTMVFAFIQATVENRTGKSILRQMPGDHVAVPDAEAI